VKPPTDAAGAATTGGVTAGGSCEEKAAFWGDISVPDDSFFEQGATFTKTWRFRNEGNCTWTTAYKIVFVSGEIMDAPLSSPFPVTVAPGQEIDLSLQMKAPTRGGPFTSVWGFENPQGVRFGVGSARTDLFWTRINVRFLDQNDQPQTDFSAAVLPDTGCNAQRDTGVEAQVLALINAARATNGLPALTMKPGLAAAAAGHSQDMACHNFVSHAGSDGSSWADRITAQGYTYVTYPLENIYVGSPTFGGDAAGAVAWWLNSPVHYANIMDDKVTETGVGYVFAPDSEYGGYYTMVFAAE